MTLWVDGDAEKGALSWAVLPLTPIAVVDSGNPSGRNYHAYHALDVPLELKTEANREKTVAYLKALCTTLKGDPSSCDIARILRVPGTYNTKEPSHPGLCRIVELNPDARYSTGQIREAITISLILRHWDKGPQVLDLALAGYVAKCGVPQGEAEALLLSLLNMTSDKEPEARFLTLLASYEKLAKGQEVKGSIRLEEYLKKDELAALDALWGELKAQDRNDKNHEPKKARGKRYDEESNTRAIEKLLENCAFVRHCRDDAATLPERHWWSMIGILAVFGDIGKKMAHELSAPYPRYTERETNQKIKDSLKAKAKGRNPHLCEFIERDFPCHEDCLARKLNVKSPAGLARRLASKLPDVIVNNRQLRDVTREVLEILERANQPEFLFVRAGGSHGLLGMKKAIRLLR